MNKSKNKDYNSNSKRINEETLLIIMILGNQYEKLKEYTNTNNILFKNMSSKCLTTVDMLLQSEDIIEETQNVIYSRYDEASYRIFDAIKRSHLSKLKDYLSQNKTSLAQFQATHNFNIINYAMMQFASYDMVEYLLDCFPIESSSFNKIMYSKGFYYALAHNRFRFANLFLEKKFNLENDHMRFTHFALLCHLNTINPMNLRYLMNHGLTASEIKEGLFLHPKRTGYPILYDVIHHNRTEILDIIFRYYDFSKVSSWLNFMHTSRVYHSPNKDPLLKVILETSDLGEL